MTTQSKLAISFVLWMKNPGTGLALFSSVLLCCSGSLQAASERLPNIVFIFVDDQGYYDLGCYGATEAKTPRIDAMAGEGMRITDYYAAAPICSPSRAGLLTGCYTRRVGNEIWVHRADSRSGIHPDELTIAELLKANGYVTACIGKWHLERAYQCVGYLRRCLPRKDTAAGSEFCVVASGDATAVSKQMPQVASVAPPGALGCMRKMALVSI